jgi:hypothetical protein
MWLWHKVVGGSSLAAVAPLQTQPSASECSQTKVWTVPCFAPLCAVSAELLLDVLVLGPKRAGAVMYCGDTAQTIARGVGFRCAPLSAAAPLAPTGASSNEQNNTACCAQGSH